MEKQKMNIIYIILFQ